MPAFVDTAKILVKSGKGGNGAVCPFTGKNMWPRADRTAATADGAAT